MGHMVVEQELTLNSTNVDTEWHDPQTGAAASLPDYSYTPPDPPYTVGSRVIVRRDSDDDAAIFPQEVYEALADGVTSYPPDNPADWLFMGAINPHRMFDGRNNSRTIADPKATPAPDENPNENIVVQIVPVGRIKFVYFIGLRNVQKIDVSLTFSVPLSGGSVTLTRSFSSDLMISYSPVGWWSWLYDIRSVDRAYRRSAGFYVAKPQGIDLPPDHPDYEEVGAPPLAPVITATLFSSGDGRAECGQVICGTGFWLGDTEWGVEPEIKDYSTYEANPFGSRSFVKRQTTRNIRGTLWVPTNDYDRVYQLFESRMNSLALYDFNNGDNIDAEDVKDALRVYGKLTSASGGLAYNKTPINLQIEGND